MHMYTLIQIFAIVVAWLIQSLPPEIGLIFPLWIICLVPARILLLPRIFSLDELHVLDPGSERLDALDEGSSSSAADKPQYGSFADKKPKP